MVKWQREYCSTRKKYTKELMNIITGNELTKIISNLKKVVNVRASITDIETIVRELKKNKSFMMRFIVDPIGATETIYDFDSGTSSEE